MALRHKREIDIPACAFSQTKKHQARMPILLSAQHFLIDKNTRL
jgi:hypothetical protein